MSCLNYNAFSLRLLSALAVISEKPELLEQVLITREVRDTIVYNLRQHKMVYLAPVARISVVVTLI